MKALVVYESMYGNTAAIGEAIAAALGEHGLEVRASLVSKVDPEQTTDVDLLVVGGPTHVHGMSRDSTRKSAAADEKNTFVEPTLEPGLRAWLARLPDGAGRLAAAYDTRIDKPLIVTGSAAKGIRRGLRRRGFRLVTEPECFLVSTQNQLLDGELAHAATWATAIAARVGTGEAVASR